MPGVLVEVAPSPEQRVMDSGLFYLLTNSIQRKVCEEVAYADIYIIYKWEEYFVLINSTVLYHGEGPWLS